MKVKFPGILLLGMSFAVNAAQAAPLHLESDARKTTLIEMFSSEGCSSCPPAETWASRLADAGGLWRDFVPVIFHVDYWDYLGWKDRFASPDFTQRQREYANAWRSETIYTPGLVLNGREWRDWRGSKNIPVENKNPGILTIEELEAGRYQVSFKPAAVLSGGKAHAALLGFGIDVDVTRGENSGRTLRHDFTVLDFQTYPLRGDPLAAIFQFKTEKFSAVRFAIAAWVTAPGELKPLQAVGGYLPE